MRVIVFPILIISVVLLLTNISDAKKSHTNRKRRSDVENPAMSDEKLEKNDIKYHDKQKQKKRYSSADIDTQVPDSNAQNYKDTKVRHQKKYKGKESMSNLKEDVKSEHKRKCDNKKCKRNRVREDTVHTIYNIHTDDDESTSSSESELTPTVIKNMKKQKKIKNYNKNEATDEPSNEYNNKKHKKHNRTMDKNKYKHEDKNANKSDRETPSDFDAEFSVKKTENKYSKQNKVDIKSHSIKTRSSQLKNEKPKEENQAVVDEITSKKIPARSSHHADSTNSRKNENPQNNDPDTCLLDVTKDKFTLDKSCKI